MFNNRKTDGAPFSTLRSEGDDFGGLSSSTSQSATGNSERNVSSHSIVDECLTMKGDLESDGDILVKGKVLGNIRCKVLIIDVDALVEGGVEAEEVIIRGRTKGTVQANRVRLEKTADVDSEICHDTFSAEEGARIKGALRARDEPAAEQTATADAKKGTRAKGALGSMAEVANGQTEPVEADAAL